MTAIRVGSSSWRPGCLSAPIEPDDSRSRDVRGPRDSPTRWPKDGLDFSGQARRLIGTGSSACRRRRRSRQSPAHLYVFQRTPTFTWPAGNRPLDPEVQRREARLSGAPAPARATFGGVIGTSGAIIGARSPATRPILEATEEERLATVDERGWAACRAWSDVSSISTPTSSAADLYREMVRRVVDDPEIAEALSPRDFPIGCKRPIIDIDYFETFNRDNVTLVDLRKGGDRGDHPRRHPDRAGRLRARRDRVRHRVRRDDRCARPDRHPRPRRRGCCATCGPTARGRCSGSRWPASRTCSRSPGPGSPSVLANMVVCIEQHVEWIGACLDLHARARLHDDRGDASRRRTRWVEHVTEVAAGRCTPRRTATRGTSVPTSPARCGSSCRTSAASPTYIDRCDAIVAAGYEGFAILLSPPRRQPTVDFDLFAAVTRAQSDASWREPRENCPVAWTKHDGGYWVVSGYDEVAAAFRDWEHFSSARTDPEVSSIVLGGSRLPLLTPEEIDPPDWYPVRRILSELLAPARS